MCIRNKLFYHLIIRRDIITKLNISDFSSVPQFDKLEVSYIVKFTESEFFNDFNEEKLCNLICIFEYIFEKRVSIKKVNIRRGVSGKNVLFYDILFRVNINSVEDIYKFFFKFSIFFRSEQDRFFMKNRNSKRKKDNVVLKGKDRIKDMSFFYDDKITFGIIKNRNFSNNTVIFKLRNFNFFTSIFHSLFSTTKIIDGSNDWFYVKMYSNNLVDYKTFMIYMSALRMSKYIVDEV